MGSSHEPTALLDPLAGIATSLPGNLGPGLDGPVVRGADQGIVDVDIAWLTLGLVLTIGSRMWFLNRMFWLHDDMARTHQEYAAWLR